MNYLVPCNPKYYDVYGAFETLKIVDWKQRITKVSVGSNVYIYVSAPVSEVCFRCVVRAVNKPISTIDDSAFIKDGTAYQNYGRYMELEMTERYKGKLPLSLLESFGLKGRLMGARSISDEFAAQIEKAARA